MSRKLNFDVNVDGRTNGRTDGRTEIWTPISHPAISRCDKNIIFFSGEICNFNLCILHGRVFVMISESLVMPNGPKFLNPQKSRKCKLDCIKVFLLPLIIENDTTTSQKYLNIKRSYFKQSQKFCPKKVVPKSTKKVVPKLY